MVNKDVEQVISRMPSLLHKRLISVDETIKKDPFKKTICGMNEEDYFVITLEDHTLQLQQESESDCIPEELMEFALKSHLMHNKVYALMSLSNTKHHVLILKKLIWIFFIQILIS